jgi:hypothetical protein
MLYDAQSHAGLEILWEDTQTVASPGLPATSYLDFQLVESL